MFCMFDHMMCARRCKLLDALKVDREKKHVFKKEIFFRSSETLAGLSMADPAEVLSAVNKVTAANICFSTLLLSLLSHSLVGANMANDIKKSGAYH